jgi:hypothetical protein
MSEVRGPRSKVQGLKSGVQRQTFTVRRSRFTVDTSEFLAPQHPCSPAPLHLGASAVLHRLNLPVTLLLQSLDPALQGGHLPLEKCEASLHLFPLHPFICHKPFDALHTFQDCLLFLL